MDETVYLQALPRQEHLYADHGHIPMPEVPEIIYGSVGASMKARRPYAERLASELLHTPRLEWPKLIGKRVFEAMGRVSCAYCGDVTTPHGATKAEYEAATLEHILTCQKRPEMKLIGAALAAEAIFDSWWMIDDNNPDPAEFGKAMARLRSELDKLKVAK